MDPQSVRSIDHRHLIHSLHDSTAQAAYRVWVRGSGAVLQDDEGNEYIDALSSLWNVFVGHGRRELAEAARRQMETLEYMSGYAGHTSPPAIELAERLGRMCYPNIQTFYFTSGGADANEAAFKTARFFWKIAGHPNKTTIISRRCGYHGTTLATMSATGMEAYWPMFEPRVPGFVHIETPYSFWADSLFPEQEQDHESLSLGLRAARRLEQAILQAGPDTVAAFIAEPVQGAGGIIVPPADYFPRIREICDRYNVLLIADEVITGFGRTGLRFALDHWGITPDILTFAKAITSGYIPLGGMGVSNRIADAIRSASGQSRWMHAYTYSGHPTACAVANANLDIIEREGLVARAAELGRKLLDRLGPLQRHPNVGEVRGIGLMAAVELVASKQPKKKFDPALGIGARVLAEMARSGVVTRIVGDVILLAPPAITTDEQIGRIVQVVGESVAAVCGSA